MKQLDLKEIMKVHDIADHEQLKFVCKAVEKGTVNAKLWSFTCKNGETYFLWDKANNVFYLTGASFSDDVKAALKKLMKDEIKDEALAEGLVYYKFYDDKKFKKEIPDIAMKKDIKCIDTIFCRYPEKGMSCSFTEEVEGVDFIRINRDLIGNTELEDVDGLLDEILTSWPDRETFEKEGFGFAAVADGMVVGWAVSEFLSDKKCGAGLMTRIDYRQQGIATELLKRFICLSREKGKETYLECWANDLGSVKLANRVGFEEVERINVFYNKFNK